MMATVRASSRGLVVLCFASLLLFSVLAAEDSGTHDAGRKMYTRICIPWPCRSPAGAQPAPTYGGQPAPGYGGGGGQPAPGYGGEP
ncbi:unnamed protein product [Urochloa humidicola]